MTDVCFSKYQMLHKTAFKMHRFILITYKKFYKILKANLLSIIGLKVYLDVQE